MWLAAQLTRNITLLFLLWWLTGCSTTGFKNIFVTYSVQMQPQRALIEQGQFAQAALDIEVGDPTDHNYVLLLLEQGRAQFLAQQWQQSLTNLKKADAALTAQDSAAQYRLSQGLNQLGTTVTNDNAIIYEVPSYERTLLHHYLALNYLALKQSEAALVEIRRANLQQEKALAAHEVALQEATQEAQKNGALADTQQALSAYPDMSGVIGGLKNGYQNAYTFYLSALLYDAAKEYNSAYIDYKRALEISPQNTFIQQRLWVLSKQLEMTDDRAQFERDFNLPMAMTAEPKSNVKNKKPSRASSSARVVFLIESGLVAAKQQVLLPLPIRSSDGYYAMFNVAMPVYQASPYTARFNIETADGMLQSLPIASMTALAAKQLQEDLPVMLVRQGVRLFAKEMLRQKIADEAGDLGNILINLYNFASETADTRSWNLLPHSASVMEAQMPVGERTITLSSGYQRHPIKLNIQAGKLNLVLISAQNSGITSRVFSL